MQLDRAWEQNLAVPGNVLLRKSHLSLEKTLLVKQIFNYLDLVVQLMVYTIK